MADITNIHPTPPIAPSGLNRIKPTDKKKDQTKRQSPDKNTGNDKAQDGKHIDEYV